MPANTEGPRLPEPRTARARPPRRPRPLRHHEAASSEIGAGAEDDAFAFEAVVRRRGGDESGAAGRDPQIAGAYFALGREEDLRAADRPTKSSADREAREPELARGR